MSQQLGALPALPDVQGSSPRTYMAARPPLELQFQGVQ